MNCPTCGHTCTPVYAAASTTEQPLLLAHSVARAAEVLGIHVKTLRARLQPWRDGYRIVRRSAVPRVPARAWFLDHPDASAAECAAVLEISRGHASAVRAALVAERLVPDLPRKRPKSRRMATKRGTGVFR